MEYKKILIAVSIPVRVKGEINPGRSHRQLVLEAESHPGPEVFEILTECIRHNIGPAVIGRLSSLVAGSVW